MSAKTLFHLRAGIERAELYYATHPRSPSAVRRPNLTIRSGTWIALLGQSVDGSARYRARLAPGGSGFGGPDGCASLLASSPIETAVPDGN